MLNSSAIELSTSPLDLSASFWKYSILKRWLRMATHARVSIVRLGASSTVPLSFQCTRSLKVSLCKLLALLKTDLDRSSNDQEGSGLDSYGLSHQLASWNNLETFLPTGRNRGFLLKRHAAAALHVCLDRFLQILNISFWMFGHRATSFACSQVIHLAHPCKHRSSGKRADTLHPYSL